MKVSARPGLCQGFGFCADVAPAVYELDESGYNALVDQPPRHVPDELTAAAVAGARACPLSALEAEEDAGG